MMMMMMMMMMMVVVVVVVVIPDLDERASDVSVLNHCWDVGSDVNLYRRRWLNVLVDSY